MKNTKYLISTIILVILLSIGISSLIASTQKDIYISGSLKNGYRVLPVMEKDTDVTFTVYRGDYIKFDLNGVSGETELRIPSLLIHQMLKQDLNEAQYFKMKEVGSYPFTLGMVEGRIQVVEFDKPQYETLTAIEAAGFIENFSPIILDVRTPQEHSSRRLDNSVLIPVQELQQRYSELLEFQNDDIFIYCATGNRSTVAAKILIDKGFTRIYNLRYGINEWAKSGLTIVR